jgi:cyclic pyranopterin phosphate synthase
MPNEGMTWLERPELLTFEEIVAVARVGVEEFGFEGLRLTGGEPTMRAQLPLLISMLAELRNPTTHEPVDLALTTNGATLRLHAQALRSAGLRRLNISLDTFSPTRFVEMTRRDQLSKVLDGIDAAIDAGFDPIKLNIVAMRGVNEDEIVDFATFGRDRGITPRFIEYMPLDADNAWSMSQVLSADEIVQTISAVYPITPIQRGSEPASRYVYRDGNGEFGVIASVTQPFCSTCDRIRLTADGKIRTCLFSLEEHDLKGILRSGGGPSEIASALERAVGTKWAGHAIGNVNFLRPKRSMSQIGG